MSLALKILPSEVEDIGSRDFDMLRRYWLEEPWGTWRDNLHAAMIAREVRRGNFKGQHQLETFMVVGKTKVIERQKTAKKGVFSMLKHIAQRKKIGKDGKRVKSKVK